MVNLAMPAIFMLGPLLVVGGLTFLDRELARRSFATTLVMLPPALLGLVYSLMYLFCFRPYRQAVRGLLEALRAKLLPSVPHTVSTSVVMVAPPRQHSYER